MIDIPQGTFSELIKTQVFFSMTGDDRVFVGDLYYDFGQKEFQLRGVPAHQGRLRHVLDAEERGPVGIDMLIKQVIDWGPRSQGNYADIRFRSAKATSAIGTWMQEWHGDRSMMQTVDQCWDIKGDLTWYK